MNNATDTVTIQLDHSQFDRPWTERECETCDTGCILCGRPISQATSFLANWIDAADTFLKTPAFMTFGPIGHLVGVLDPSMWAVDIGPTCAKKLPKTHRMKAVDVWNTPMENQ